jgi:DNA-binding IclR family transcriptional regulator
MHARNESDGAGTVPIPRSPQRVMQLLEALASAPGGLSLTNLSKRLASPKSSLLNLLRALELAGYVESASGLYRIGPASLPLGAMLTGGNPFLRSIRPLLRRLAHDTGETALIGILTQDGRHAMPVESVESRNPLRFAVPLGKPFPLHASTMGRAILAFKNPEFIAAHLDDVAATADPKAPIDGAEISRALADTRRSGVAELNAEHTDGILGFGAPIFDGHGWFEAAVVVGGPADRIASQRARFVSLVHQAGAEMSEVLGFTGPYPAGAGSYPADA